MIRLHTFCSLYRNSPLAGIDELAEAVSRALSNGSKILTLTPALSNTSTLAPVVVHTATLYLDNELFKQFMKAYLERQILA